MALANLSIYYTWKNIEFAYNNNKFKISAPTWNNQFDLSGGSYSILDIQDYFEYIIKNIRQQQTFLPCRFMCKSRIICLKHHEQIIQTEKNRSLAFKNNALFISCILKINNVLTDNAEDLGFEWQCTIWLNTVKTIEKQEAVYGIITKMCLIIFPLIFLLIIILPLVIIMQTP